jgi:rSAM/selenodomain-associated transferase 2
MTSNISIIIPTLNEAENLPSFEPLTELVKEVIIVDGGSNDATVQIAKGLGFTVLTSDKGRGMQLNLGAEKASSTLLLFLHADTLLPSGFPELVEDCLLDPKTILGAFSLLLDTKNFLLRSICAGANLRSRYLSLPYGDQAFFLRKHNFHALGGFPKIPIMEDYVFVKQAQQQGKIRILPQTVTTSARRWQTLGPLRTTIINQLMILGYRLGVSPEKLASFYRSRLILRKLRGDKGTNSIG